MRVNNSSSGPSSWMGHKEQGKTDYERGNYEAALSSYGAAVNSGLHCPAAERQIILSNMVACRLKVGGAAQAEAAVKTAKQCVAVNNQWAKGHIRLASAYIALGGHSNDACNALQRAMQLDPGNPTARDMLLRELRRDHHTPTASAPPADEDDQDYTAASPPPFQDQPLDDAITWQDKVHFYYARAKSWYFAQSDEKKSVFKVFVALIVLYVTFGGRFGLGHSTLQQRGNYEAGNVYDQYYGRVEKAQSPPRSNGGYGSKDRTTQYERSASRERNQYSQKNEYDRNSDKNRRDQGDYYNDRPRERSRSSSSFHFPNLLDGSAQSIALLAGLAYVLHRNGINPMQALFLVNMMGGGRRRHRGMGMGGYGRQGYGGFGRRRY